MSKIEMLLASVVALTSLVSIASFFWGRRSGKKKIHHLNGLELQKLNLKEGEVVLIKTDQRLLPSDMQRICEGMKWGADTDRRERSSSRRS